MYTFVGLNGSRIEPRNQTSKQRMPLSSLNNVEIHIYTRVTITNCLAAGGPDSAAWLLLGRNNQVLPDLNLGPTVFEWDLSWGSWSFRDLSLEDHMAGSMNWGSF